MGCGDERTFQEVGIMNCPYCKSPARLADSVLIYGNRSYGYVYVCQNYPKCDAYVGCHRGSKTPFGALANRQLREVRHVAHGVFDLLWKRKMEKSRCSKRKARSAAYLWLGKQMGIPPKNCHIGMFDVLQCEKVVELCRPYVTAIRREK